MKELTKSEEQMMDIFWDSKEALTSVDIVKMQVKATWTNGLVHNIIRSLVQNGYLKECGMEQFGRQYARKLMPALTRKNILQTDDSEKRREEFCETDGGGSGERK